MGREPLLSFLRKVCRITQAKGPIKNNKKAHFISIPIPIEMPKRIENFLLEKLSELIKKQMQSDIMAIWAKSRPKNLEYLKTIGYKDTKRVAKIPTFLL